MYPSSARRLELRRRSSAHGQGMARRLRDLAASIITRAKSSEICLFISLYQLAT